MTPWTTANPRPAADFVIELIQDDVNWRLKRRELPFDEISNVRLADGKALRIETGWPCGSTPENPEVPV
jgi:hypothetical protein